MLMLNKKQMRQIFISHLRYLNSTSNPKSFYRKQSKHKIQQQLIYGLNSVQAALHSEKRQLYELFISDSQVIELNSKTMKLINFAKQKDIKITYTQRLKLDRMAGNSPHQNVVLKCSALAFDIIGKQDKPVFQNGVYVYTDKITDPQNFGAIIRSSLFFGVKHIFASKKNHCPLNPTVSKASTGAVELMPISLIQKSEDFLENFKSQGGHVLSTEVSDINKRIYSVQQLQSLKNQDKLQKILIILGSQGFGVSDHLRRRSDYNILIDRKGQTSYPYSLIDSLNVNAALTAILFELTKDVQTKRKIV